MHCKLPQTDPVAGEQDDMGRRRGNSTFPIARVKKIMQADEEVGKIATSTPVLVAKALECLMEDVLKAAAMVAGGRNSKTVQAAHLKQCIADDDQFDFLRPTVASVPSLDDPANQPVKRKRPRAPSTPMLSGSRKRSRAKSQAAASQSQEFNAKPLPTANKKSSTSPPPATKTTPTQTLPPVQLVSPPPPPAKQMEADDDDDDYDEEDGEEKIEETKVQAPVEAQAQAEEERQESASPVASGTAERVSVQALLS